MSQRPSRKAEPTAQANERKSRRVLLVEDDLIARNALRMLLRANGHTVSCVGTIAEALAALSEDIDTIILDLMLPDGDGIAVLERVRAAGMQTRVCVTTAVGNPAWIKRVQNLSPNCILQKPIDLAELLDQL